MQSDGTMHSDIQARLLNLLKQNARRSTSSLAQELGISRTTVQDRLRKLEEQGIVSGYTVRLNKNYDRNLIRAHVMIRVLPKRQIEVVNQLRKMPHVSALHAISGIYDLLAILTAENTEIMDRHLDTIGELEGIERTETSILLSTKFDRGA